jgi:uncharacterized membrane protein (UPF0127 family)
VDERGRVVCANCENAASPLARMRGLLGRAGLAPGQGLLITRTSSVHTLFMRFPIDVVFLDRRMRVRSITRDLRPFRAVLRLGPGHVLELAAGEANRVGLEVGNLLAWHDGNVSANHPTSEPAS